MNKNTLGGSPLRDEDRMTIERKSVPSEIPLKSVRQYLNGTLVPVSASINPVIDLGLGNIIYATLESNVTLSFINPSVGVYIFYLRQDATGSRTVTWPSDVKWPSATAPTLTTTGLAWDIVTLVYDGLYFSGTSTLNFVA